jgi:uncharacterized protein (DUF58 family)
LPVFKFIILMLALAFIITGMARPQFGSKLKKVKREGIELIIALDVSNSMMAEDIEPNRLERAKRAISRLVDRLKDDKIGLIVFAGDAYTQLPITSDNRERQLVQQLILQPTRLRPTVKLTKRLLLSPTVKTMKTMPYRQPKMPLTKVFLFTPLGWGFLRGRQFRLSGTARKII